MRAPESVFVAVVFVTAILSACGRGDPGAPAAPASAGAPARPSAEEAIAAAVNDTTRIAEARARDPLRRPQDILAFSGIGPGDRVAEIAPGGGYDTALLSRVVGPTGRVHAIDSEHLFEYLPSMRETFQAYIAQDPRGNVEYSVQRLDSLDLPEDLDVAWISMFYHDTIWLGVDRAAMNRSIFEHLKPGGVYLVIDHHAAAGAGEGVSKDLHRVDAATVRSEIEAAGFVLAATSDVLANPSDPRTDSVFDDRWRGRTDRFVWKFVKPE